MDQRNREYIIDTAIPVILCHVFCIIIFYSIYNAIHFWYRKIYINLNATGKVYFLYKNPFNFSKIFFYILELDISTFITSA